MTAARPPRLALALLDRLSPDREALVGDLLEELSRGRSRTWFWQQVLFAVVADFFRRRSEPTLGIGESPSSGAGHRMTVLNISGTGTRVIGGAGAAFLGLLATVVVPQFWLLPVGAAAGGVVVAAVLVVLRRRALCLALVATAGASLAAQEPRPAIPIDPVAGILDAFTSHDVVALPGGFGAARRALLYSLVRDPRFPQTVNDIVVEFGSARFQDAMDRYIRGEGIAQADLRRAWQDTTTPTGNDSQPVEEFFEAIRDLNRTLPGERRVRILLGDPPIDWDHVRTMADHRKWVVERDMYAGDLIRRESVVRGRRALLLYGQLHYPRKEILTNYEMSHWQAQTLVSWLESAGTKVFSIWATSAGVVKTQPGAASWPQMRLALLRGTQLGAADFTTFDPGTGRDRFLIRSTDDFAPIPRDQFRTLRMEDQFDAILYTGGGTPDPPIAVVSPSACAQPGYVEMRVARIATAGMPSAAADAIRQACAPRPMAGTWIADLASSKLHKGSPIRTATLKVAVAPESVTITDSIQNAAGQEIGTGTTTFRTDGKPYPHDALMPGLIVTATWSSTNLLETVMTRKNGQTDRVTYEVSSDGKVLTTRTSGPLGDQVIVFRRQP